MKPGGEYICNYNQTLSLSLNEEDMDTDSGSINLRLKCGAIDIPLQIKDEPIKPVELTGVSAFKWKHREKRGLEYLRHSSPRANLAGKEHSKGAMGS